MKADKITTVVGALGAGAMAAQPVLSVVGEHSLHSGDYMQLVTAVLFAVLGFFTNKGEK